MGVNEIGSIDRENFKSVKLRLIQIDIILRPGKDICFMNSEKLVVNRIESPQIVLRNSIVPEV